MRVNVTITAVLEPSTRFVAAVVTDRPHSTAAVATAALSLVILSTYFLHFQRANASFAAAGIPHDALPAELARWAAWHWFRTLVGFAALASALLALRGMPRLS